MKTLNEVIDGLSALRDQDHELIDDAITTLIYLDEVAAAGGWDVLKRVSRAYAGGDLYLYGRNGMIYSRGSGKTMPLEDAIDEFVARVETDY